MLSLAIKAGLPLIKVVTDDTLNVGQMIIHSADSAVTEVKGDALAALGKISKHNHDKVFYIVDPPDMDYIGIYNSCVNTERSLIVVNPSEDCPLMFDVGVLRVPEAVLKEFLSVMTDDETEYEALMTALSGLTLKDVVEVCRLCMAEYHELTPRGIGHIRRLFIKEMRGVQQVNTEYPFYSPRKVLTEWLAIDGQIFTMDTLPELIPRGILFDGEPGTGKTMAAKYLANELHLPLYRLDLGSMMAKYVGESERNLNLALQQVDQMEPCILIIDEVEKLFKSSDDSGVTSRLLSQLLWWTQEHTSRVLTLLTTNDVGALPKELYRPGRIDEVMMFDGLNHSGAKIFVDKMLKEYGKALGDLDPKPILDAMYLKAEGSENKKQHSQAAITQNIYKAAKANLVT